jgi:hypothetical protein
MQFEPKEKYDAVLMNPPFSNRMDAEHIQRAFDMLKPGGKLVAIAGEGVFFGTDKKAQAFREWLDEHDAQVEKLPQGTFQDTKLLATTGTNARMLVIDKPSGAMFSRRPAAEYQAAKNALAELSKLDDIFQLPKSDKTTIEDIAADNSPDVKVKELPRQIGNRTEWQLTFPDGEKATITLRPHDPNVGVPLRDDAGRRGCEHEHGAARQGRREGGQGRRVARRIEADHGQERRVLYNIAATFAHNTDRIFIGDPAGLSDDALAPAHRAHAQLGPEVRHHRAPGAAPAADAGDAKLGVPPLNWTYGDDIGNIEA